jgi:hypothetical protein
MMPQNALTSTTYCLADGGKQYLAYQPASRREFTMQLLAGTYDIEWFNPASGAVVKRDSLTMLDGKQSFTAPFDGDSVLYLVRTKKR